VVPPRPVDKSTIAPVVTTPELSSTNATWSAPGFPATFSATNRSDALVSSSTHADVEMDGLRLVHCCVVLVVAALYCQVPCNTVAAFKQMDIPAKLLAVDPPTTVSAASEKALLNRLAILAPGGFVSHCSTVGTLTVLLFNKTGASFTAIICTTLSVSISVLHAVVPPRVATDI
jgi:hypothetical protein